jgi:hypothetical protein
MKPGDRIIWLYSPGRSFLSGWRLQEVPGIIVRVCRHPIRIRVQLDGREKLVNVDPENVISYTDKEFLEHSLWPGWS